MDCLVLSVSAQLRLHRPTPMAKPSMGKSVFSMN